VEIYSRLSFYKLSREREEDARKGCSSPFYLLLRKEESVPKSVEEQLAEAKKVLQMFWEASPHERDEILFSSGAKYSAYLHNFDFKLQDAFTETRKILYPH
jgi:hypothetical protein